MGKEEGMAVGLAAGLTVGLLVVMLLFKKQREAPRPATSPPPLSLPCFSPLRALSPPSPSFAEKACDKTKQALTAAL